MRLFLFNDNDWIAAKDEEQALQHYKDEKLEDDNEEPEIVELPEEEWPNKRVSVEDEDSDDSQVIEIPFSEYMQQFSESDLPLIVASKDW